jgi:hypothetical protein
MKDWQEALKLRLTTKARNIILSDLADSADTIKQKLETIIDNLNYRPKIIS